MITHYFCKSNTLGIEKINFNRWHAHEINAADAPKCIEDRNKPATLTRLQALELCNKWSRIAAQFPDGGNYYIL